ncbi:hypothetical protein ACGF12_35800 [Kitasatospora sp. NPDC048296]|uniref:hypothetical protein n=1 Tax=Kitasatospora sp. NPDC048296 TaxID=3364048 RepID=UPI0037155404
MAVERVVNNPSAMDLTPSNMGQWQFYKQGFAPSTGVIIDSEGNITAAGTLTAAGVVNTTGVIALSAGAAATVVLSAQVTGDAQPRFTITADGTHWWGSGAATPDVNLYRYAANGMATDDALKLTAGQLLLGPAGDVNVYRSASGNLASDLNIVAAVAGKGFQIKEGANARMGVSVLVAGTVTVANTSITASTRVQLTIQSPGGTVGVQYVSARTAGTSFTITSNNVADTSTVAWLLIEPAP